MKSEDEQGGRCPAAPENGAPGTPLQSLISLPLLPSDQVDSDDPFSHPTARAYSCYSGILEPGRHPPALIEKLYKIPPKRLMPTEHDERVVPLAQVAHDQLRAHILGEYYPCLGARAAFHLGIYRFCFYKELAHETSVLAMGRDLRRFVEEHKQLGYFTSFVAAFKYPQSTKEAKFEKLLWKHLQMLHEHDGSKWDPHYEPDPASPHFAFSFAGCAFFLVGMHSGASRFARRFAFPALVMNPEWQIHRLKREGFFEKFAEQVRLRDTRYQGQVNPSIPVDAASQENEARAYSGATHSKGSEWKCPFHPRPEVAEGHERIPSDLGPEDTDKQS